MCLTETWIRDSQKGLFEIKGYDCATSFYRKKYKGGGTAIYIREGIDYTERQDIKRLSVEYTIECCAVEIPSQNLLVVCVYRLDRNIEIFHKFIQALLDIVRTKDYKKHIVIGGDYNIDMNPETKDKEKLKLAKELTDYMLSSNLHLGNNPTIMTRVTKTTMSCIDLVFTNNNDSIATVEKTGIGDHCALIYNFSMNKIKPTRSKWFKKIRSFTKENLAAFREALNKVDWKQCINQNYSVNKNYNNFHSTMQIILDKTIPKIKVKITIKRKKTWLTRGLKISCKHKRMFKILVDHSNSTILKSSYKKYEKLLKKCVITLKRQTYISQIKKSENKNKCMWNVVSQITNKNERKSFKNLTLKTTRNVLVESAPEVADMFNKYFASVGESSRGANSGHSVRAPTASSIYLYPTNEREVYYVIRKMKDKLSYGPDEIPPKVIKFCINELLTPIVNLINQS
ncbi:endonuclease-reverse transcriptase domain-containing protein [Phthorimaea operculella]|nr:endonuclease-reverse transcriptase domain-containing protein [Phthorimaea operculella]